MNCDQSMTASQVKKRDSSTAASKLPSHMNSLPLSHISVTTVNHNEDLYPAPHYHFLLTLDVSRSGGTAGSCTRRVPSSLVRSFSHEPLQGLMVAKRPHDLVFPPKFLGTFLTQALCARTLLLLALSLRCAPQCVNIHQCLARREEKGLTDRMYGRKMSGTWCVAMAAH
jgi:hypothetical protein